MLRLINAALNDELFFSIADHTVTVVDVDAAYVMPFDTDIYRPHHTEPDHQRTPRRQAAHGDCPPATHLMLARPYSTANTVGDGGPLRLRQHHRGGRARAAPSNMHEFHSSKRQHSYLIFFLLYFGN
jgi:hypothetical protein